MRAFPTRLILVMVKLLDTERKRAVPAAITTSESIHPFPVIDLLSIKDNEKGKGREGKGREGEW